MASSAFLFPSDPKYQILNELTKQTRNFLIEKIISQIFGKQHKPSQFKETFGLDLSNLVAKFATTLQALPTSTFVPDASNFVLRICYISSNFKPKVSNEVLKVDKPQECGEACAREVGYRPTPRARPEKSPSPRPKSTTLLKYIPDRLKNLAGTLIPGFVSGTWKVAVSAVLNGQSFPYKTTGKCDHGCDLETSGTMYKTKASTSLGDFVPGKHKMPAGVQEFLKQVLTLEVELEFYVIEQMVHLDNSNGDHSTLRLGAVGEAVLPRWITYADAQPQPQPQL